VDWRIGVLLQRQDYVLVVVALRLKARTDNDDGEARLQERRATLGTTTDLVLASIVSNA
jgi:hypothetical protein